MEEILIRDVDPRADAPEIARIYNHYITETTISFETEPLTVSEMQQRISTLSPVYPYFVAVTPAGKVAGYCYVHQWKERAAYNMTVEASVYLDRDERGHGLGQRLTRHLLDACRRAGFHAVIACITGDNHPSIAMVERLGFEKVSHFRQVGLKFDRYLDVVDYQLTLTPYHTTSSQT